MILKDMNFNNLSRLVSQQVDLVTCIECCKYYVVPTTASCGHSLCNVCWRVRRTCPYCSIQVEKKKLKLNLPLQHLTNHIQVFGNKIEDFFKIKLNELILDIPTRKETENPINHVTEWLTSSQNHFSAPITDSQQSFQGQIEVVEKITSNIQIHSENIKKTKTVEVVHVPPLQLDWDKIEEMPDTENKNKENLVGPMDIEPFDFDEDKQYSNDNPRRSSRHKENKDSNLNIPFSDVTSIKISNKNLDLESDNKSHKLKNWHNVKRMKKEFSKLNKKNKNKLNVSIEMCKKTHTVPVNAVAPNQQHVLFEIHDNSTEIDAIKETNDGSNINEELRGSMNVVCKENVQNLSEDLNMSVNSSKVINRISTPAKSASNFTKERCITIGNNEVEVQKVCFFKKSALNKTDLKVMVGENKDEGQVGPKINLNTLNNTDDIEIIIKIGSTLTNICIKKKENDVHFKINSDKDIQTSLENIESNKKSVSCSPIIENIVNDNNNIEKNSGMVTGKESDTLKNYRSSPKVLEKTTSIKKNTASADTTTVQMVIESSEKSVDNNKLSNNKEETCGAKNSIKSTANRIEPIPEDMESIDLDIFDSESVHENVQYLKSSKNTPSAILMPTVKSKSQDKRTRVESDLDLPSTKKIKLTNNVNNYIEECRNKVISIDSEISNYDAIMSQVFANIDADMGKIQKTTQNTSKNKISQQTDVILNTQGSNINKHSNTLINQKYSENVFSILEKELPDSEILEMAKIKSPTQIQNHKEDSLIGVQSTSAEKENVADKNQLSQNDMEIIEFSTPIQDDASNKSIVEETPQKTASFSKIKKNCEIIFNNSQRTISKQNNKSLKENSDKGKEDSRTVINLSDTSEECSKTSKNVTVVETVPRTTLETPHTMTKFFDQIKHRSTPMARKSLNFTNQKGDDDQDQTLCQSMFVAAKTTQEKEFMRKAFDETQNSNIEYSPKIINKRIIKYCVAGSCLSSPELGNLKFLCIQRNWKYVDKYSKELTHLVVGVDEEKKSQRSVKYMCALAGGKWIVSYEWVERCLQIKDVVDEEPFEALDGTGEPGPRRSRTAKEKLFEGITFYCMPPFSVLDVKTLENILESAGGRVVAEARGVRAGDAPALLLAEPEHTQEDRFIYLAMELGVVPINYEWVLNCLGSYGLSSIHELLLCPASLLPPSTNNWPSELISRDFE